MKRTPRDPLTTSRKTRRRIVFRVAAVFLALLPFVVLEGGLRLLGIPASDQPLDPLVDLHQLEPLFTKVEGGERFEIPTSRSNYFQPASFSVTKPAAEFRIFVLGGSTVQGRPYATETAFPAWLELSLKAADASRNWKTINCGGVSYASYRVGAILKEVLEYEPDLIVLYTGHNEFLEDRTYGNWKKVPRWMAVLEKPISSMSTTRLISQWFRSPEDDTSPDAWTPAQEVDTRLDHVGGLDAYVRDARWRTQVIDHFEHEFEGMLRACRDVGVPVLACVPVSDLVDTPPFKVSESPDLEKGPQQEAERNWNTMQTSSSAAERSRAATELLAKDPEHAGAAFYLGRESLERGDVQAARLMLTTARDNDVCPLRAPTEIQNAVRRICEVYAVPVVDVARLCEDVSEHGIVGADLLVDHVHPSIKTHQKIAAWIFETLERKNYVEPSDNFEVRRRDSFEKHWSTLNESYFARGQQRLAGLKNWAAGRAGKSPLKPAAD